MLCFACKNKNTFSVNTYKHRWILCDRCGSILRKHKDKYLFSFLGIKSLAKDPIVAADNSRIYDYFESDEMIKSAASYFCYFNDNIFKKFNINLKGKRILDISGDNGTFIKEAEKLGAKVAMTEYNLNSVTYARDVYKIESARFDINKDNIADLFPGKFDIILLRAIVMFCLDLNKFLSDLKKIVHKDTLIIYNSCVYPNLAPILRWQFDDYTYNALYQPEMIVNLHKKQSFKLIIRDDEPASVYTRDWTLKRKLFVLLYEIIARLKIPINTKFKFRERMHKHTLFIFKLDATNI